MKISVICGYGFRIISTERRSIAFTSTCSPGEKHSNQVEWNSQELERAGAYRVYKDPAYLLNHLDEVGVRREE